MKKQRVLIGTVTTILLVVATGLTYAHGPGPVRSVDGKATLGYAFTYQGHLGDGGDPVDGICDLAFKLYDEAGSGSPPSGGTLLGTVNRADQQVSDGTFTVQLDFGSGVFAGEARWLEIDVDCGDGTVTLSPRQALTATPYALYALGAPWSGLTDVPPGFADGVDDVGSGAAHDHWGETWSGSGTGLTLNSSNDDALHLSGDGDGLQIEWAGDEGVFVASAGQDGVLVDAAGRDAFSAVDAGGDGLYVKGAADDGVDVRAAGDNGVYVGSAGGNGIYVSAAHSGLRVESAGTKGVYVKSASGPGVYVQYTNSDGLRAGTAENDGVSVYSAGRHGVYVDSTDRNGVYIVSAGNDGLSISSASNDGLHVGSAGHDGVHISAATRVGVYAHTAGTWGFYTPDKVFAGNGYVDIAEHIDAASEVEAGDVVVIDPDCDERVLKSTGPYDTLVAGVISTDPAMVIGKSDTETPLALAGRVPCKVSTENGPIHRGDLLTTSSTPGHAMKATELRLGTILGKAMGELESGTGVMPVLLTLQ